MAWQFAPGEILTAANLNAVTLPWNAICVTSRVAAAGLSSGAATNINWDTDDLDPLAWHSTGVNPDRVLPSIAGWYEATVRTDLATDTDYTQIRTRILRTGGAVVADHRWLWTIAAGAQAQSTASTPFLMNGSSEYVVVEVTQTNGNAAANNFTGAMSLRLLYPT